MKILSSFQILNNLKVRTKLLMIYILCIVVPVLITNIIFANRIIISVKNENTDQCNNIMDTVLLNIDKEFESVMNVSTLIYTDSTLNKALNIDYTNSVEKVDTYTYFKDYISRIRTMYTQVLGLCIYTSNNTIPWGGDYVIGNMNLDNMSWSQSLKNAGKSILFYTYTENGSKYLSVIRNLNYFSDTKYDKEIKIDLNLDVLIGFLKNNSGNWDIYLINNKNEIIASSNNEINNMTAFPSLDNLNIDQGDILITRDIGKYDVLHGWRLVGVFPHKQLYKSLQQSSGFVAVMVLLDLFTASAIILLISQSINRRLKMLADRMRKHDLNILDIEAGSDEIGDVIREYNTMSKQIQDMIRNEYEYEIEIKNAELERKQAVINALQSQINPHFLFNTLEAIRMRSSLKKEDETAGIIKSLSKIFRRMLTWKEDMVPLKEEINFIKDYLAIQQYRFGDKINYQIIIDPHAEDIKIPKMTIQPFVENSCFHGIESIKGKGVITIRAEMLDNENLRISIEDNGKGIDEERLKLILSELNTSENTANSIGIKNVYNRLSLLYGENMQFEIKSSVGLGTKISVIISFLERK